VLIHTNNQLKKFYLKCQKHKIVAVDTEFYRVDTYYPVLCLIQLANLDEIILIDPLEEKIDLKILGKIFKSNSILKVFHAASQDLEIFFNLYKQIPNNIIDTQICIALLGLSDSLGYADSLKLFLKKKIDKSFQFIDWRKRPLSVNKVNYAINDVKYLIPLYKKILKIMQKDKIKLNIKKSHKKILIKKSYIKSPNLAWEKLKIINHENYRLSLLKEICKQREKIAKKLNVPIKRIIKDQEIKIISNKKTKTKDVKMIINLIKNESFRQSLKKILIKKNI